MHVAHTATAHACVLCPFELHLQNSSLMKTIIKNFKMATVPSVRAC